MPSSVSTRWRGRPAVEAAVDDDAGAAEPDAVDGVNRRPSACDNSGDLRPASQERALAEVVPRAQHGDEPAGPRQLDLTVDDEVEVVAVLTLADDHSALGERDRHDLAPEARELVRRQRPEESQRSKQREVSQSEVVGVGHLRSMQDGPNAALKRR